MLISSHYLVPYFLFAIKGRHKLVLPLNGDAVMLIFYLVINYCYEYTHMMFSEASFQTYSSTDDGFKSKVYILNVSFGLYLRSHFIWLNNHGS